MKATYGQYTGRDSGFGIWDSGFGAESQPKSHRIPNPESQIPTEMQYRLERDPRGERKVPADAYYGVQTARAIDNFSISGLRAPADLVTATILVKKAAAEANASVGRLDPDVAGAGGAPGEGNA